MNETSENTQSLKALNKAFKQQRLTLFLGAGVSVANGLPTWDRLVLSIYFATIGEQHMAGWRPFSNYLYAISEWYLDHSNEPLEITARKVRSFYENTIEGEDAFLEAIRDAIYGVDTYMEPSLLLQGNETLKSIVKLCGAKHNRSFGVRSVITYNYDSLLEMTLEGKRSNKPVFSKNCDYGNRLPIFHVHGYVPYDRSEIKAPDEIIFTEDQYNIAASDPYSWSNIVQLREMSSSVGLMIGLSITDRNIRRLLDALSQSPIAPKIYALLQKPQKKAVTDDDAESIHAQAIKVLEKFNRSGIKGSQSGIESGGSSIQQTGFNRPLGSSIGEKAAVIRSHSYDPESFSGYKGETQYAREIRGIISAVELLEQNQQEKILQQLGIAPIWYDHHSEISDKLQKIYQAT